MMTQVLGTLHHVGDLVEAPVSALVIATVWRVNQEIKISLSL